MFDRTAAEECLHRISQPQIIRFLSGPDRGDVYGFGFFCDAHDGTVYLVANTERNHLNSLREFEERYGPTDPAVFQWDIGNWEYPGGLFPSSSAEQHQFEEAWREFQEPLSQMQDGQSQGLLEEVCAVVLKRLLHEGTFSTALGLKGFTVLGFDDAQGSVLEKKKRFDSIFQPTGNRAEQ